MARECAFCPETAKLSAEHVWSEWMDAFFPGKKRFIKTDAKGVTSSRMANTLDWTVKVVCANCNNTWMSDIENLHAKPAMGDLIKGILDLYISQSQARSIAIFATKTAIVIDHIQRKKPPFFSRTDRHKFAQSLTIPFGVAMWIAGFLPRGRGEVVPIYHGGALPKTPSLELYVCTYAVGHFAFQVAASRQTGFIIAPKEKFQNLAVPLWPRVPNKLAWPPNDVLRTVSEFHEFAARWGEIVVIKD
jgi:hypothetical protein